MKQKHVQVLHKAERASFNNKMDDDTDLERGKGGRGERR